jgi:glycosyltransferase involved in cell wall biosynthesis
VEPSLTRIVTLFNQWRFLDWLEDDRLFDARTEFIVVDDCSRDTAPPDVADRLAARGITLLRLPRNQGRCAARNAGATRARGEFVDFIDGDDRPLPVRVDPAWSAADVVFFTFEVHGIAHDPRASWVRHPLLEDPQAPNGFLDPRPAAVLWRRSAFLAEHGFDARFETSEDLELVLRTRHRPRAFCAIPKQSYNEQPRTDYTEIAHAATRLAVYRRLPSEDPRVASLIAAEVRALHLQSTWRLLRSGERRYLFRSCLALLRNLLKPGAPR